MRTASCRSCHAPIVWARTERDKRMPLDASPAPAEVHQGFVLRDKLSAEGPLALSVTRAMVPGEEIFTSHFSTCAERGREAA